MKKRIKAKWCKALRSGEYTQGKSVLRSLDDKFCCLGVLLDITDKSVWKNPSCNTSESTSVPAYLNDSFYHIGYLSVKQQEAFGFDGNTMHALSNMNDHENKSFTEIAEWIETNL